MIIDSRGVTAANQYPNPAKPHNPAQTPNLGLTRGNEMHAKRYCPTHGTADTQAWGCPECIAELRRENSGLRKAQRWLLSSQQLPPIGRRVLMKIRYIGVAYIGYIDGKHCLLEGVQRVNIEDMTHWQYLPALPDNMRITDEHYERC